MKLFVRCLVWGVLGVTGLVCFAVALEATGFEQHRGDIRTLVANADPEERELPGEVEHLLLLSLDGNADTYATRLLMHQFQASAPSDGYAKWKATFLVWSTLLKLQFSEKDCLTLVAHLAPLGGGHVGFANTAKALFGHPLSQLSPFEAGSIIVLAKEPLLFEKPGALDLQRERLLEKARGG